MRRSRKRKKQRKIIVVSVIGLLCIMSAGYAAFQTNLNINAKGNIVSKGITPQELKNTFTTKGDGLYKDQTEENRYIYRGTNPNNYIKFNNELWRIISVEKDNTLKIMKVNKEVAMAYDAANARTSDYCNSPNSGCNVWGSSSTMLDENGISINAMKRQFNETNVYVLPAEESQMSKYLNNNYYNTLNENAKKQIDNHLWNVGLVGNVNNQTLETDYSLEQKYKWRGNVGLLSITDYIKSSLDPNCTSVISAYGAGNTQCKNNNYLIQDVAIWTLTPWSHSESFSTWSIYSTGVVAFNRVYIENSVFPVVFLKSNIYLKGDGTQTTPYTIN